MARSSKKIAVVQGVRSSVVQDIFRSIVERWYGAIRIAGVIEEDHGLPGRRCHAGYLRSIVSGERYAIFQDLGPGAEACHLDGTGAVTAAETLVGDIHAGCGLVVISKFGKLEAAGSGLAPAFAAAFEAEIPVLTSVSPALNEAWALFATPLFEILPPEADTIMRWWQGASTVNRDPHSRVS